MLKSEPFLHLEETLEKAQELMVKVTEQNEQWSGGGAFEKDIVDARGLLKEAQTGVVEVADAVVLHLCKSMDIDVKSANDVFDVAYHFLNLMYDDTKRIQISLEKAESQTKAIRDLEIHLKKFNEHCQRTRHNLLEAAKMKGKLL